MEFQYVAIDSNGRKVSSKTNAETVAVLVSRLKNQGLVPLSVSEVKSLKEKAKSRKFSLNRRVTLKELAVFTRQLSATLNAGILLTESLDTIADDLDNLYMGGLLKQAVDDINGGKSFSQALAKHPNVFPHTFIAIIRSGEESGMLGKSLMDLSKYLEAQVRLRETIKTAMQYPTFVFGFFVVIVSVIVLFIIPKFKMMFDQLDLTLPLLTRMVIGVSQFCIDNILIIIGLGVAASLFLWYALKIPKLKIRFDFYKLRLPIVGKIILKVLVSRFCRTLSIMLSGGVGMLSGLSLVNGVIDNLFLKGKIENIRKSVIGGASLSDSVKAQQAFPALVTKMISVGERSGKLGDMLMHNAEFYDEEVQISVTNLTSLIEPVLIILIGIVVGIVVLSFYLPIIKISVSIR